MTDKVFYNACKDLWEIHDLDNDRMMSRVEFEDLYLHVHVDSIMQFATPSDWKDVFLLYDQNIDGLISWDEAWFVFQMREKF